MRTTVIIKFHKCTFILNKNYYNANYFKNIFMALINKSGILSTIQDSGRVGYASIGINPTGVMDKYASRLANILLNNQENEAVLEIHFPSPEILFEENCIIAIGGANFSPFLNNKPINNWQRIAIKIGNILKFKKKSTGERAYIAFAGGLSIEPILGSASTNLLANFGGKKIVNGDRIVLNNAAHFLKNNIGLATKLQPNYQYNLPKIRITTSKEFNYLENASKQNTDNQVFKITNESNRMGYRLNSEPLKLASPIELLSSGITFGTIQLLPNGQLIVLMADHQTTGGYPRIGSVISVDLPILAQMGANQTFKFKIISIAEAEQLLVTQEKTFQQLKLSIKQHENY